MKLFRIAVLAIAAALASTALSAAARAPKLVVMLVVDQMRGDYIDRYGDHWTGGLHRLVTEGAWFRQADYPYASTVTCAGHATVSTGSWPSVHGMIGNTWWDRDAREEHACASDEGAAIVSYGSPLKGPGESAHALRTTTLADELRAQQPTMRTIAFSLKARSVVTLAGQTADAAAWFDDRGEWVTSTAYTISPTAAVQAFVRAHPVTADFGRTWDRLQPPAAYLFESRAVGVTPKSSMTAEFPHVVSSPTGEADATFFSQWQSSPFADAYLAAMALDVVKALDMGKGDRTDFVGISFSSLDKVGHDFGPRSHEIQDILLRLDQTLGGFFAGLDASIGRDHYVVALTADHGVAPIPESVRHDVDSGRVSSDTVVAAIEDALRPLGPGKHVAVLLNSDAYLARGVWSRVRSNPALLTGVVTRLKKVPGVLDVYTRDQLAANRFDDDAVGRRVARSYDAERSGDLVIVFRPYWLTSPTGTGHGTPFGYDTRVPILLMGRGIRPGEYLEPASPADIAPTLALLSGVTLPRAQGRVLGEALTPTDTTARSLDGEIAR